MSKYERIRTAIKCVAKVYEQAERYMESGRTEEEAKWLACKENEEALDEYQEEVKEVLVSMKGIEDTAKALENYPELVRKLIALRPI